MLKLFRDPTLHAQDLTILILVIAALAVAVIIELRTTRIPNWLVLTLLAASIGIAAWDGGWNSHLGAFVITAVVGMGGFVMDWWPGGVGKLGIAIGALCGMLPALAALATTVGICLLLMSFYGDNEEIPEHKRLIPGSPALAAGTLIGIGVQMLLTGG